jgi:hypothetical protein
LGLRRACQLFPESVPGLATAARPDWELSATGMRPRRVTRLAQLGYDTGTREAARLLSRASRPISQKEAYELSEIIRDGRQRLLDQNLSDLDIEVWDNACRIMFLLSTVRERNSGML